VPSDSKLIITNLQYDDIPKIFNDEVIYEFDKFKDLHKLEVKEFGKFNNSLYINKPDLILENTNLLGKSFGRILLHEWFLLSFPEFFQKYANTIETLFITDEFIPITWRFYIALMVFCII